jgi:hypothetical protein
MRLGVAASAYSPSFPLNSRTLSLFSLASSAQEKSRERKIIDALVVRAKELVAGI